ncbi:MAG: hypothetical protein Q9157_001184 [Trypethelium eluteriae]
MAEIRFEDIQAIQFLQDKFQELAHVFDMDRRILRDLQNRLGMLTAGEHRKGDDSDLLRALLADSNIQMSRINSMLKRLDATIALVCLSGSEKKVTKENRFVQIDGEFWVFIVLTSVLLSVTFGAYVWYLRRHRAYLKNGHAEKEA